MEAPGLNAQASLKMSWKKSFRNRKAWWLILGLFLILAAGATAYQVFLKPEADTATTPQLQTAVARRGDPLPARRLLRFSFTSPSLLLHFAQDKARDKARIRFVGTVSKDGGSAAFGLRSRFGLSVASGWANCRARESRLAHRSLGQGQSLG